MRLFFLIVVLLSCTHQQEADSCLQNNAVFDIGSGTTRIKVARVDVCLKKINKILLEKEEKIDFKKDLEFSKDARFSNSIQHRALKSIALLKELSKPFDVKRYDGVATSAFRDAANGKEVASMLSERLGINVRVVSGTEEGKLGYFGALAALPSIKGKVLVWDIGGGSLQWTFDKSGGQDFEVYSDNIGSVSYKASIVRDIKKQDFKKISSPNPIGFKNLNLALRKAQSRARKTPVFFKNLIKDPDVVVLGISGLHYYSIRGQTKIKGYEYTLDDVRKAAEERVNWDDAKIGGRYAATDVSNLILVYGYMKELGIKKVRAVKTNLTDGLLMQML